MRKLRYLVSLSFTLSLWSVACGQTTSDSAPTGSMAEGDGDVSCVIGNERCACYPNATCNGNLSCLSDLCVRSPSTSTGDGGSQSGSGGGESGSSGGAASGGAASGGAASGGAASGGAASGGTGGTMGGSGGGGTICSTSLVDSAVLALRWKTAWPELDWSTEGFDALDTLGSSATPSEVVLAAHKVAGKMALDLTLSPAALACAMQTSDEVCFAQMVTAVEMGGTSRSFTSPEKAEFEALFESLNSTSSRATSQRYTLLAMLVSPAALYDD